MLELIGFITVCFLALYYLKDHFPDNSEED